MPSGTEDSSPDSLSSDEDQVKKRKKQKSPPSPPKLGTRFIRSDKDIWQKGDENCPISEA